MHLSGNEFSTLRPGDEIVFRTAISKLRDTVAFLAPAENAVVTANGLAVISSLTIEKTGNNVSEFAVFPDLFKTLNSRGMIVDDVKKLRVGDCVLAFADNYLSVKALTVVICDPVRKIAFGKDGRPISVQNKKLALTGLREDPEKLASIGTTLLSDRTIIE